MANGDEIKDIWKEINHLNKCYARIQDMPEWIRRLEDKIDNLIQTENRNNLFTIDKVVTWIFWLINMGFAIFITIAKIKG